MGYLTAVFYNLAIQAITINPNLKYAETKSLQGLYGIVQSCLKTVFSRISNLYLSDTERVPIGARVILLRCNLRYELDSLLTS